MRPLFFLIMLALSPVTFAGEPPMSKPKPAATVAVSPATADHIAVTRYQALLLQQQQQAVQQELARRVQEAATAAGITAEQLPHYVYNPDAQQFELLEAQ